MEREVLRVVNLVTAQRGQQNLEAVSFAARSGEIVGVTGSNASGIGVLAEVLCGHIPAQDGVVYLEGAALPLGAEQPLAALGVFGVSYRSSLVPQMTVAENLCIMQPFSVRRLFVRRAADTAQVHRLFARYGVAIDPAAKCYTLSAFQRELVEMCRALLRGVRLLVLYKTGESCTREELETLRAFLRGVRDEGVSILCIDSNAEKLSGLVDNLHLLRRGYICASIDPAVTDPEEILRLFAAPERPVSHWEEGGVAQDRTPYLRLEKLASRDGFAPVSFTAFRGHCLGILSATGVADALLRVFLRQTPATGTVWEAGRATPVSVWIRRNQPHICCLDRRSWRTMLFPTLSIGENLMLRAYRRNQNALGIVKQRLVDFELREYCDILGLDAALMDRYPHHLDTDLADTLVFLSLMISPPRLLLLNEPYFTSDAGIRSQLVRCIAYLKRKGTAILCFGNSGADLEPLCTELLRI